MAFVAIRRSYRIGAAVLGLLAVLVIGGSIVEAAAGHGKARRGVSLEGVNVAGDSRAEVTRRVQTMAASMALAKVDITAGSVVAQARRSELGITLDVDVTVDAVMKARRPAPIVGWLTNLGGSTDVAAAVRFDEAAARRRVNNVERLDTDEPVEPAIVLSGEELAAAPGRAGVGIDPDALVAELRTLPFDESVVKVEVAQVPVQPNHQLGEVEALVADANVLTAAPLTVQVGSATTELSPGQLRGWMTTRDNGGTLTLAFDERRSLAELTALMAAGSVAASDASIAVVDAKPVITASVDGATCCAPEAVGVVLDALRNRTDGPVALPTTPSAPAVRTADLEALRIAERVSTFTTKHRVGEPRVKNIHLAADILRGTLIKPGGELSLNAALGPRTRDRGFVEAPAIQDGELKPDVGGGISQLATTLFNAAFFAGLDYGDYQSHSLYISRYPFAREATVNNPAPDLVIKNPTEYGILVWPSYTGTTVTVELYSTKWVSEVRQGTQTGTPSGASCLSVTTERLVTYVDGTTKTDSVRARYRAREKLDCNDPLPPGVPRQRMPAGSITGTTTTTTTAGGATTSTVGGSTTASTTTGPPTGTTTSGPATATSVPGATTSPTTTGATTTTSPTTTSPTTTSPTTTSPTTTTRPPVGP
jgi:vancomycin resistance protein YoaR